MTRIGTQKMQRIIQVLFATLPESVDVCSAAERLLPYINGERAFSSLSLLGQQVALRPELSLSEIFTITHPANTQPLGTKPRLAIQAAKPH